MTNLADIDCAITIEASRERTWSVLITPELVQAWLGCTGFAAEVGTLFHMQPDPQRRACGSTEGATHCVVKTLEPPDRLGFSWFLPGTPETHVEIVLSGPAEGPTTARLVHCGWGQFEADSIRPIREMLDGGWRSFVLPNLKRRVESPES